MGKRDKNSVFIENPTIKKYLKLREVVPILGQIGKGTARSVQI